ncbi:MAG: portal protein [Candidatus Hodarchaeota archaeon]
MRKNSEIIERIFTVYKRWTEYFQKNINLYHEDIAFAFEELAQWTGGEIKDLKRYDMPILEFNRLPKFINNILGSYAENPFNAKVRAIDAEAARLPPEALTLREDLLRGISNKSRADLVQIQALLSAIAGGFGAFQIGVEQNEENPFLQDIVWRQINDPTLCFWDVMADAMDKGDGKFCGKVTFMDKEFFEELYPKADSSAGTINLATFYTRERISSSKIIAIIDYWEKEYYREHKALMNDGTIMDFAEANELIDLQNQLQDLGTRPENALKANILRNELNARQQTLPTESAIMRPSFIEKDKMVEGYKIKFYRVTTKEILEKTEWDGKFLPIIFQAGQTISVKGEERCLSYTRFLKDPQRSYNWARTEHIFRAKNTRYSEVMGEPECLEGVSEDWTDQYAKRFRKVNKDSNGQYPVIMPTQQIPPSIQLEAQMSLNDINDIAARFAASLGDQGNERSGVAILQRQLANAAGTHVYIENAKSAIESAYRVILDLIPKIYDSERIIDILDKDQNTQLITLNSNQQTDVKSGKFAIVISAGASSRVQKAAALDTLVKLVQINPNLFNLLADKIFANIDLADAPEMVERVRQLLPPNIILKESKDPQELAAAQQAVQQQQQMQQLTQQLQMQNAQLDLLLKQNRAQQMQADAQKTQVDGAAEIMNAETNRIKVQAQGAVEAAKIKAEENRTVLETLQNIRKLEEEIR